MDDILAEHEERHFTCTTCHRLLEASKFARGEKAWTRPVSYKCRECQSKKDKSKRLREDHGITQWDYDQMAKRQDGRCMICHCEANGKPLNVDHCHNSGRIRGLLCSPCNMALGLFKDNPLRLLSAVVYLARGQGYESPQEWLEDAFWGSGP